MYIYIYPCNTRSQTYTRVHNDMCISFNKHKYNNYSLSHHEFFIGEFM